MYEGHFQLERRPFAATPDPSCCYLSPTMAPQFHNLATCAEQGRGIAILTGPAGIGKTLLSQVLLTELQSRFTGVYLGTGQFATRRAFLQAILYELGQPYGGMSDQELRLELSTALKQLISQKDGLLLVLDEAHLLSDRLLEEVRLLADLSQQGVPLVRVVLCGNPEFEERLTAPALTAFNQRVACHESIDTLLRAESLEYLTYRVEWAGGNLARLFEPGALQLIVEASDGVPRCLNQLADHSLSQAFRAGASIATETIVRDSLAVLQSLPLRWNASALLSRSWTSNTVPENSEFNSITQSAGDSKTSEASVWSDDARVRPPESANRKQDSVETTHRDTLGQLTNTPPSGADLSVSEPDSCSENDGDASCCFEFGAGDSSAFESTSPSIRDKSVSPEPTQSNEELSDSSDENSMEFGAPESLATQNVEFPDESKVDGLQVEDSKSDEDMNRPVFSWLAHPAAHSESEFDRNAADSSSSRDTSRPAKPLKFQFRSLVKTSKQHQTESSFLENQDSRTDGPRTAGSSTESRGRDPQPWRFAPQIHDDGLADSEIDPDPLNNLTWNDPVEEVIVDRYAALDAGFRSASPKFVHHDSKCTPAVTRDPEAPHHSAEISVAEIRVAPNDAVASLQIASHQAVASLDAAVKKSNEDDGLRNHPDEQLETICALIETDNESSNGGVGVELITDWGVERIDIDLSAKLDHLVNIETDQLLPFDINDFLGSTVVDVGRSIRQQPPIPEPKQSQDSLSEPIQTEPQSATYERAAQYDIVIPEEFNDSMVEGDSREEFTYLGVEENDGSRVAPPVNERETSHSRFHNLFSTLRRRKSPSDAFFNERQKVGPIDS